MQFNKNKSSPSILSIVNVVFTRKKQNSRKKASTIFFIKRGQETGGERRARGGGSSGVFVDAPVLQSVP